MSKKLPNPIKRKQYLTYMNYAATGEGCTFELNVCFADTKAEAIKAHLDRFQYDNQSRAYFSVGVMVVPLKSKKAKEIIEQRFVLGEGLHKSLVKCGIECYFKYYVNAS